MSSETSCAPPSGGECSAAPAGRAFPVPAQRLAGVCDHPLRGSAGWSCLCQHLLLHQQGGRVTVFGIHASSAVIKPEPYSGFNM